MKTLCYSILLSLIPVISFSQETEDQNPNHQKSLKKYRKNYESLRKTQGTTAQETYEAYDYLEIKEKRKQQKREWQHKERMARYSNPGYFNHTYYSTPDFYWNYGGYYSDRGWRWGWRYY